MSAPAREHAPQLRTIGADDGPMIVGVLDLETDEFRILSPADPGDRGGITRAFVLFRHEGWPVGTDVLPVVDGQLGDVRRELMSEVPSSGSRRTPSTEPMSVVICTRNRPELLGRSLAAFLELTGDHHELIVIDNAPLDDRTALLVESFGERVRRVVEPDPGLARARNRGLEAASCRFVAFTDDDVTPDSAWLDVMASTFARHPGAIAVTGSVLPMSLSTEAELRFHEFGGYGSGFNEAEYHMSLDPMPSALFPFHPRLLGTGANMAFRVEALRSLGGFDTALGAGTLSRGGEDIDIAVRILMAGHLLVRQPAAVLWHPSHAGDDQLARQIEDYGCGLAAVFTKFLHHRDTAPALVRRMPATLRQVVSPTSSKNSQRSSTFPRHLARAEWKGIAKGPVMYRRARRAERRTAAREDLG
jgi:GT2 family glycosyltransferase